MKTFFRILIIAAAFTSQYVYAQTATDSLRMYSNNERSPAFFVGDCAHGHICCQVGCHCCPQAILPSTYDTSSKAFDAVTRLTIVERRHIVLHRPGIITYVFKDAFGHYSARYHSLMQAAPAAEKKPNGFSEVIYNPEHGKDFENGTALTWKNDHGYVLINETGQELPLRFHSSVPFNSVLDQVSIIVNGDRVFGLADKKGELVTPLKYHSIRQAGDGMAIAAEITGFSSLLDSTGKPVTAAWYINLRPAGPGLFIAGLFIMSGDRPILWHGIINDRGEIVAPFKYESIEEFSEGLAVVRLEGRFGYIDEKGREVIACSFDDANDFYGSLAKVYVNEKSGFIDKSGKMIVPAEYDDAGFFVNGFAMVRLNDKWGYVNRSGKLIIPPAYKEATDFTPAGTAFVSTPLIAMNNFGMIDSTGKLIIPFRFQFVVDLRNGFFSACIAIPDPNSGNKFRGMPQRLDFDIVDIRGNEMPHRLDFGIVDIRGNEIVPFKSAHVNSWQYGGNQGSFLMASSKKNPVYTLYDSLAKPIATIGGFDHIEFNPFHTLLVVRNNKYGVCDYSGKAIIPCKYEQVITISPDLYLVRSDSMHICLNSAGKEILSCSCDGLGVPEAGLYKASTGNEEFYLDMNGKRVRETYLPR
jgi:hypothetical protein